MFRSNSRYVKLPTLTVTDPNGREVSAVKLRVVPRATGQPTLVRSGDQLDVMSERRYRDATGYWRIADANDAFEANGLVAESGRVISVPEA
jgi:nucleoid-associated protein YgaU